MRNHQATSATAHSRCGEDSKRANTKSNPTQVTSKRQSRVRVPKRRIAIDTTASNFQPKTFSDLPRELRDKVYEYLVVSPDTLHLWDDIGTGVDGELKLPRVIKDIRRVSTSLAEEAVEVFLSGNRFCITPAGDPVALAEQLPRWKWYVGNDLEYLRHIELRLRYGILTVDALERRFETHDILYSFDMAEHLHVTLTRNDGAASYCVCGLKSKVAALMQNVGCYHGEGLLDFLLPILRKSHSYRKETRCETCDKLRLVRY